MSASTASGASLAGAASSPAPVAISVAGLRKAFGSRVVFDGIDLVVAAGSVCALLGPRGAGKTTMVRLLSTLTPADSGTIRVAGHRVDIDGDRVRAAIGLAGGLPAPVEPSISLTSIGPREVVLLDEPTAGLDPVSRAAVWQSITDLADGGVTVLLTTQSLEEADQVADRIALLDQGRLVPIR